MGASAFAHLERTQNMIDAPAAPSRRRASLERQSQPFGLAPSRVPLGARAAAPEHDAEPQLPAGYKSKTEPTAGGLTGINLDVTFSVSGTPAAGLQIVQTFMGTRRSDGVRVGTYSWKMGDVTWDAFVDGGKNSPYVTIAGNSPAHPTRPYYLTADEVSKQVTWDTDHGTIETTDAPGAAALHDEAHFETAVVAIDAGGGHSDKVLRAFKWGWSGKGTKADIAKGTKIAGADSGVLVTSSVSAGFKNIVKHDYPSYNFS